MVEWDGSLVELTVPNITLDFTQGGVVKEVDKIGAPGYVEYER